MKTGDFQALVEQLGDLSESQQQVVVAALRGKGSASDAIRLIERQFEADLSCGHCGERSFGHWGTPGNGFKRYKWQCCGKTFTALTGTPLSGLHKRDRRVGYARALVDGVSLREGGQTLPHRPRHVIPLAPLLPQPTQGREGEIRQRHCRGRRDILPQIGQGLEEARGSGAQETWREGKAGTFDRRPCAGSHRARPIWGDDRPEAC
jgi:transposase-like protein